jgi:hypothetical protein
MRTHTNNIIVVLAANAKGGKGAVVFEELPDSKRHTLMLCTTSMSSTKVANSCWPKRN